MAVKIRLKRIGKIRQPYYRIVVVDARKKRDGRVIEEIGVYQPKHDPSVIEVGSERAQYWLGVGAQPSDAVLALLKLTGDWQQFKGEPAPGPLKVAEPKRSKEDLFNEALADVHAEPASGAVTSRSKKMTKADGEKAEPAAEEKPAEPAAEEKAAEATADEKAETPAATATTES